ncbi:MAG: zinc ABC transporter substrate-binding protein, partial [Acidobacteriota bacterium]|nr:zinc ABC transporter substrate-binding protein [Acidobacteriota bacterium]
MVLGKFGLAAVVVAAAALGGAPAGGAARPVIVSGVSQWAALARAVAGPDATVVSLLSDPNADPHDHEATARDARTVARAALVIENGAGYDTWVAQLVAARARPPAVIDAARLAGVAVGRTPHLSSDVGVAETVVRGVSASLTRRGA